MQRTIKISCTKSCKPPSGVPYSNTDHSWTVTQEIEMPESNNGKKHVEEEVKIQLAWMESYLGDKVKTTFDLWENFRTRENPPEDHYRIIEGRKVPRVTSIITPDRPEIPHIEDHAELGTLLDETWKDFIDYGVWVYRDYEDKGNIRQSWDDLYFAGYEWLQNNLNGTVFVKHSVPVFNGEWDYCGELDAICKKKDMLVIADFKKTEKLAKAIKEKYYMQMAAYAKALPKEEQPQGMVIISPFNKPQICPDIDLYFDKFIEKRKQYKQRFGL